MVKERDFNKNISQILRAQSFMLYRKYLSAYAPNSAIHQLTNIYRTILFCFVKSSGVENCEK